MHRKGINYDVGTLTISKDTSSRETFDPLIIQREMEIIKNDLHCTAIRISGQDIARLTLASEYALQQGLEVWFSPRWIDANEQEMITYLAQCAQAAEQLRQQSPQVIFVVGCELTFFLQGLVEGAFVFTFVMPSYPYDDDLVYDLDMASYSLVKTYTNQIGQIYNEMPWEPKESFKRLARYYQG